MAGEGRPTDRATFRPNDRPSGLPTDRTTDRPNGRPNGRPTDRTTDRPTIRFFVEKIMFNLIVQIWGFCGRFQID